jgi:hypothetical protein
MAKTTRYSLTLDRKLSDDAFGSYGAAVTEEVELEGGDDLKEVRKAVRSRLTKELDLACKKVLDTLPAKRKLTKET